MLRRQIGVFLVAADVGLCYWGRRLENKDREEQIDSEDGPYAGQGGAMVLTLGAILTFVGLLLMVF